MSMLMWRLRYQVPAEMRDRRSRFYHWLARHAPKRLVYWCTIVAIAHATTGKYGDTVVPELSAMDALGRYGKDTGAEW